jgi:hypothetical protein
VPDGFDDVSADLVVFRPAGQRHDAPWTVT